MEATTQDLNGWQNVGKITQFALGKVPHKELAVYLLVARMTAGYCKAVSNGLPVADIVTMTGASKSFILSVLKSLMDAKFIIRVSTNHDVGPKQAYKYKLNYELEGFPYVRLDSVKTTKPVAIDIDRVRELENLIEVFGNTPKGREYSKELEELHHD